TIFWISGTCILFLNPNSFMSAGTMVSSYFFFSLAAIVRSLRQLLAALRDAHFLTVSEHLDLHAGALLRLRIDRHHVRDVDRAVLLDDAALRVLLAATRLQVALDLREALDHHAVAGHLEHLALLALLLTGDDDDEVVLLDARCHD